MFNFSDILGLVDNLQGTIVGNALGLKDEEKEKVTQELKKFKQKFEHTMELKELEYRKELSRLEHEKELAILNNSDTFIRHWHIYKQILRFLYIFGILLIFCFNPEFMDKVIESIQKVPRSIWDTLMLGGVFGTGAIANHKLNVNKK